LFVSRGPTPAKRRGAPPPRPASASLRSAPLVTYPEPLGSAFGSDAFERFADPSSPVLQDSGASEASAGSGLGWGPHPASRGWGPATQTNNADPVLHPTPLSNPKPAPHNLDPAARKTPLTKRSGSSPDHAVRYTDQAVIFMTG